LDKNLLEQIEFKLKGQSRPILIGHRLQGPVQCVFHTCRKTFHRGNDSAHARVAIASVICTIELRLQCSHDLLYVARSWNFPSHAPHQTSFTGLQFDCSHKDFVKLNLDKRLTIYIGDFTLLFLNDRTRATAANEALISSQVTFENAAELAVLTPRFA
jgi:hypothetical protein